MDESEVRMAELMTPDLQNFAGKIHGGAILNLLDKVAYVCACRYSGAYCVTVAVDEVEFREAVLVGELLLFTARVVFAGRTSMDVEIVVESQDLTSGATRHTNACYFTLVALREGKPVPVPELRTRSPEDRQRWRQGELRRQARDQYRKQRRALEEEAG
jgi:acyl-CoA hydrolase